MRKRLFLLPIMAGLALTGCDFNFFGLFGGGDKSAQALQQLIDNGAALKEFKGYEVATKVEDGGEYLLGVYRKNEDLIRFANGDYHKDAAGTYPFYMATVSATTEGAAKVTVKFQSKDKFSLQVSCPGKPWDGKYIGLYPTKATKNFVTSLALLDDPNQKVYTTIPNHQNPTAEQKNCYGLFTWFDYCEGSPVCAPGITMQHPDVDEEPVPKFFGTGHDADAATKGDYTSIDAKSWEAAIDNEAYDLMHLYKKK